MNQQEVAPSLKQRFGDWIDARTAKGVETYGTPLMTFNGRSGDAIEELLDFCQYQEQDLMEAKVLLQTILSGWDKGRMYFPESMWNQVGKWLEKREIKS